MSRLKFPWGTVHNALKHFEKTTSVVCKARSRRSKVTTLLEDQYIRLCSLRDRKATSLQMHNSLNTESAKVPWKDVAYQHFTVFTAQSGCKIRVSR